MAISESWLIRASVAANEKHLKFLGLVGVRATARTGSGHFKIAWPVQAEHHALDIWLYGYLCHAYCFRGPSLACNQSTFSNLSSRSVVIAIYHRQWYERKSVMTAVAAPSKISAPTSGVYTSFIYIASPDLTAASRYKQQVMAARASVPLRCLAGGARPSSGTNSHARPYHAPEHA
eukprot:425128-Pleurochrysis_carterae.AAC.1